MRASKAALHRAIRPWREIPVRWLLFGLLALAHSAECTEIVGRVVSISDGDTLRVLISRKQIKVRLLDIVAP